MLPSHHSPAVVEFSIIEVKKGPEYFVNFTVHLESIVSKGFAPANTRMGMPSYGVQPMHASGETAHRQVFKRFKSNIVCDCQTFMSLAVPILLAWIGPDLQ
jgi:hypothetical protein